MPNDVEFRPKLLQRPIQILKRPTSSQTEALVQNNIKPQIKTYEQREKEYKEARSRIMGSTECEVAVEADVPRYGTFLFVDCFVMYF